MAPFLHFILCFIFLSYSKNRNIGGSPGCTPRPRFYHGSMAEVNLFLCSTYRVVEQPPPYHFSTILWSCQDFFFHVWKKAGAHRKDQLDLAHHICYPGGLCITQPPFSLYVVNAYRGGITLSSTYGV